MIVGIGTDIIEIERIKKACERDAFLSRVYTEKEIKMSDGRITMLADNFAVKEAVSKCFGTGIRGFNLSDVEVLRDELGKPFVNLYGPALEISKRLNIKTIHTSISNTDTLSIAFCVAEGGFDE